MAGPDRDLQSERANLGVRLALDAASPGEPSDVLVARWRNIELTSANDESAPDLREREVGAFQVFEPLDQAAIEPGR